MGVAASLAVVDGVEDASEFAKLTTMLHGAQEVFVLNLVPTLILLTRFGLPVELEFCSLALSILRVETF
jgi:hypothetical protein